MSIHCPFCGSRADQLSSQVYSSTQQRVSYRCTGGQCGREFRGMLTLSQNNATLSALTPNTLLMRDQKQVFTDW